MSSASARLLTGTSSEYTQLEATVANLFNKDACLIFNTGYQCNLGVISALCSKGDVFFSDKLNHASIIDGMKLSEGEFIRHYFTTNQTASLKHFLPQYFFLHIFIQNNCTTPKGDCQWNGRF